MIQQPDCQKRYNAAKHRFFKPVIAGFFAKEFPKLFGPVMREKLADELIKLFETTAPETKRLKPGQILWNALDKKTRGDSPNRRYVTVTLSMITDDDVEQLAQGVAMSVIAQNAIARIMREAYEQGGILSSRDIGLLTLRHPTDISRLRKKHEKLNSCTLPHTGALHDMGTCISHKATILHKIIVEKKDPSAVAQECKHSQWAVDRYLKDYHRVKTLFQQNKDIDFIHLVTGIAKHVVREHIKIIEQTENSS